MRPFALGFAVVERPVEVLLRVPVSPGLLQSTQAPLMVTLPAERDAQYKVTFPSLSLSLLPLAEMASVARISSVNRMKHLISH